MDDHIEEDRDRDRNLDPDQNQHGPEALDPSAVELEAYMTFRPLTAEDIKHVPAKSPLLSGALARYGQSSLWIGYSHKHGLVITTDKPLVIWMSSLDPHLKKKES